jgi:hypothetical protein
MPAESVAQRRLFGIVRGLQEGTVDKSKVSGEVKEVAKEVSPEQADHFAKTPEKGLPEKKKAEMDKESSDLSKYAHQVVAWYDEA